MVRVRFGHAAEFLVRGLHVGLLVLLVGLDQLIVQVPVVPAQRRKVVARVHRTLKRCRSYFVGFVQLMLGAQKIGKK